MNFFNREIFSKYKIKFKIISLLVCLGGISLISCQRSGQDESVSDGSSVFIKIPIYQSSNSDGSSGNKNYRLQVVEFKTITQLNYLKGRRAEFTVPTESKGNKKLLGFRPVFRFFKSDKGYLVPRDSASMQMASTYYFYEKLAEMDERVGMSNLLKYPRQIFIAQNLKNDQRFVNNNALYSVEKDALIIAPFDLPTLPLMANAGVIGHEHFHALFAALFINPLREKMPEVNSIVSPHHESLLLISGSESSKLHLLENNKQTPFNSSEQDQDIKSEEKLIREKYHKILLRGINEGLADFWGWIFSEDPQFVGRSLQEEMSRRDIEIESLQEASIHQFNKDGILSIIRLYPLSTPLDSISYQLGTQLARILRHAILLETQTQKTNEKNIQEKYAKILRKTIEGLRDKYQNLKEEELLDLSDVLRLFILSGDNLSFEGCEFLAQSLKQPTNERDKTDSMVTKRCQRIQSKKYNVVSKNSSNGEK